jgi:hypothetical protein
MTSPGYYNTGKRLEEGKYYLFQVIGLVTLQDERAYFILEDPFKIRHLLPSRQYTRYEIQAGQSITCKVDKINCTGRVYLEPKHPHYVEGNTYDFEVISISKNPRSERHTILLNDMYNNEISADCPKDFIFANKDLKKISCKIVRIRKGMPTVIISNHYRKMIEIPENKIVDSSKINPNHW